MSDKEKLQALAKMVAAEIDGAPPRPRLRLVSKAELSAFVDPGEDTLTRSAMATRIRDLARLYWLAWLVRQEVGERSIDTLPDDALRSLLEKMERARECRVEGIGFDEVPGLVNAGTVAL